MRQLQPLRIDPGEPDPIRAAYELGDRLGRTGEREPERAGRKIELQTGEEWAAFGHGWIAGWRAEGRALYMKRQFGIITPRPALARGARAKGAAA